MNLKRAYPIFLRVGFALAIAFLISQFRFEYIEAVLYDARVRLRPAPPVSGHVELIAVDPHSVERMGHVPSATDHIKLLQRLKNAGARDIVYLLSPNEIVGSADELADLAKTMKATPGFYVASQEVALRGEEGANKLLPPFEGIKPISAPKTADRAIFAGDGVTRRIMISYQEQPMLHPLIAKTYNPVVSDESKIRGMFEFLDSKQTYIDFRPAHTYIPLSFDTASAEADSVFHDKIVIVGRDIQSTPKDYVQTPFSRDVIAMSVLELHANIFDTLIQNSAPEKAPAWIGVLLTGFISILTVYLVLAAKPTRGLAWLGISIGTFCMVSFGFYWLGGVWIPMAQTMLAIFICYYFFIPYRLIIENRRSWEYYQKNRLLTQVEELKTNFLSMMSHDLKTPIARIQGMTDVVLHDPNPLSPRQSEALSTLSKSSQELLEFVSSILNLGRIESKELKLHMASRDPNALLTEVAEKLDYFARSKQISIKTELEPVFSLKMDADLMKQVFTNLIENAIKYSPENSAILITSEEEDGQIVIQVSDQGQGIPEDELPFVFEKFYRSKNAKSSAIKGSGLGLYLAKYFVELHQGSISVDSQTGEGSTFTVELPVND
jgi:signal transduction histidine kinase